MRILNGLFRQIEWHTAEGWKVAQEQERKGLKIRQGQPEKLRSQAGQKGFDLSSFD